ncbi:MAG: DegV family protein [Dehalococcoidales bacterium]|nr:DegV family protein [Dehalococcoidales bacterium]
MGYRRLIIQEVTVITDSIACLSREMVAQYGIEIVPINFYSDGRIYKDWVDITPAEAYELFLKDTDSFKTAAAFPEDCLQAYRNASRRANNILCITVSAKLSAVYNVARQAKEYARKELAQVNIEVLDSQTAAAAQGFIVLAAARAAVEGKDLTEVIKAVESVKNKVNLIAFMDTVRYVYRTGRIPRVASWAGSVLNIKPTFTISSGIPYFMGAVRNKERGMDNLLKVMRDKIGIKPVHVAVMHTYSLKDAENLKKRVLNEFNCIELWLTEFSPVMGYACGTGTLGLAFYSDS